MNVINGQNNNIIFEESKFYELFKSHRHFGLIGSQELKRAERYCSFLSLVTIQIEFGDNLQFPIATETGAILIIDDLQDELHRIICKTLRETDYVSGFESGKIGILLVETSRGGAEVLLKRIKSVLDSFLDSISLDSNSLNYKTLIVSFPNEGANRQDFQEVLNSFIDK
ncbi:MAG: hypothetical protein GF307_11365 [candidate division Zixibacteria bacterium]|nr:hypothetical protein [candidate division Zixibacteria bacterium]